MSEIFKYLFISKFGDCSVGRVVNMYKVFLGLLRLPSDTLSTYLHSILIARKLFCVMYLEAVWVRIWCYSFLHHVLIISLLHQVTTVDKYQGQQNDIALVSLVRTKAVGHVRDLRRLIVAASRARLGLYVFARANLFRNCFELQPTFNQVNV